MPAKVNREEFLHALESIQPGLSPREIVEQSSCYVLRDGFAISFNDEIACKVPSGLNGEFTGAVVADKLLEVLRKLPEEEIELRMSESELLVKGKWREAGIRMEKDITLATDAVEEPTEWLKLHEDFADAVNIVQQCSGSDETQFAFTCVHIHPKWVESGDNFQFCRWRLKTGVQKATLVRQSAIKPITSLGMTEFAETENWLHFRNPHGLVYSCRRYLEEYQDLREVLTMEGVPTALPKGLTEAAEKAEIFSAENAENNLVRVDLQSGKVTVKGQGISGWYRESKKVNYSGEPLSFLISPKLLGELVKKHNSVEVSADRLKVKTDNYTYISLLFKPDGDSEEEESEEAVEEAPKKKRREVEETEE